jgi:hypothetical protein
VPEFELPLNLVRDVERHDAAEAPRRAWLADLPQIVDELARRWSLDLGQPFQPGGTASWVAPARNGMGAKLVLKVGWRHDESEHEAEGPRSWRGKGTVLCVDALMFGQTSALVIEACDPGAALSNVLPSHEQDAVAADLLRQLWIDPPPGHPLRTLASMCDRWAEEFEAKYAGIDPNSGWTLDSPGPASSCSGVCRATPSTPRCCVPTCTRRTSWLPGASPGWSSIRSPTLATRPMTRCNTCSTSLIASRTPSASPNGWPRSSTSTSNASSSGSSPDVYKSRPTGRICERWRPPSRHDTRFASLTVSGLSRSAYGICRVVRGRGLR